MPKPKRKLTPEQEEALFQTEAELSIAQSDLQLAIEAHVKSVEAAKKDRDGKRSMAESLLIRMADIVAGRPYQQDLDFKSADESGAGK